MYKKPKDSKIVLNLVSSCIHLFHSKQVVTHTIDEKLHRPLGSRDIMVYLNRASTFVSGPGGYMTVA